MLKFLVHETSISGASRYIFPIVAQTVFLLSKSRRSDVAEGWCGVEVVAMSLLHAWLGVCRAMFAAWSRLTSVRLLLIAGGIPKAQNFRYVLLN